MANTQQIWKFSWNPSGYRLTNQELSTIGFSKGHQFSLSHTFFSISDFFIYYMAGSSKRYLKCHTSVLADTDILFIGKDESLSALLGKDVFSRIELVSDKSIGKALFYDYTAHCDVITFDSLGQELHKTADVEHKSITVQKVSTVKLSSEETATNKVEGEFGNISKDKVTFLGELDSKDCSLSKNGVLLKEVEKLFKIGNEFFNISFNRDKEVAFLQTGEEKEGVLFRGPNKIENVPVYGIPVILPDDPSRIAFVPWLSIDPNAEGIKIGSINIKDKTFITDTEAHFFKDSSKGLITISGKPFVEYDLSVNECYLFGGIIKVNLETKEVKVNGIVISESIFKEFTQIQRDITFLKSKLTN